MNPKIKQLFTSWRILLLIFFIILSLIAINPRPWVDGVAIRSVERNSSAELAGIESPGPTIPPTGREVILSVNNQVIHTVEDFDSQISLLEPNRTITIKTNKNVYRLVTQPLIEVTILNETELITVEETFTEEINGSLVNVTKNITRSVPKKEIKIVGTKNPGLTVYPAPTANIRKGLDLQGGTRVLLQPEEFLSEEELEILLDNMRQRLNVYGLTDVVIRSAQDLPEALGGSGKQFIIVEIAGATEQEVNTLLAQQGKFEAKIGNTSVFRGGEEVTYVCRTATCSGIDPNRGCGRIDNGYACSFYFQITLSQQAAQAQADATKDLPLVTKSGTQYVEKQLDLYLDDVLVDQLNIGADLKGRAVTEIAISGSGVGITEQAAITNSLENMKRLQTILITGSLPVKLDLVKTDRVSPSLGEEFLNNSLLVALYAFIAVAVVVFIRYRKLAISIPLFITLLSEVILLLGFASLVGWNIDLAAIAGIIIALGTGVDHQIMIVDETLKKETYHGGLKSKIKRAFSIIFMAYLTTSFAMVPLIFAGAGLLKGFALVTIAGLTLGVLITRPAFGAIIEILLKE